MPDVSELALQDKWVLSRLNGLIKRVRASLDSYELGIALGEIYDFIWDVFCDWYIELSKTTLSNKESAQNKVSQNVIVYVLESILKLLHPFMPFITEEIYQSLPHFENAESIMISTYPEANHDYDFASDEENMARVIEAIREIRARRNEMNVPPSRKAKIFITTRYNESFNDSTKQFFEQLASASEVEIVDEYSSEGAVQIITHCATIYIPMAEMIDTEKEKARLNGELAKVQGEIDRLVKKLSNPEFTNKAPEKVVNGEKEKLAKYEAQKSGIEEAIKAL